MFILFNEVFARNDSALNPTVFVRCLTFITVKGVLSPDIDSETKEPKYRLFRVSAAILLAHKVSEVYFLDPTI